MNIDYETELESVLDAMFPETTERERIVAKLSQYGKESFQREAPRVKLSILRISFNQPHKLDY